jgi:phage terminase Nu1 subunit (DNA packaging protein)
MTVLPFTPVTKKRAADILQVSIRTLDYWLEHDEMPAPEHIGRQCYWHPDVFFAWLTAKLSRSPAEAGIPLDDGKDSAAPATSNPVADKSPARPAKQGRSTARQSPKPSTKSTAKRRRPSVDDLNAP